MDGFDYRQLKDHLDGDIPGAAVEYYCKFYNKGNRTRESNRERLLIVSYLERNYGLRCVSAKSGLSMRPNVVGEGIDSAFESTCGAIVELRKLKEN